MSYTLTQYQTTPGISRDYVSTFELGSFSANSSILLAVLFSVFTWLLHYVTL
jgi:hypothetical protein